MRPRLAVALGVLLLAAALLAAAPASLLDAPIAAASGGKLRLADAAGTIWRGSGELVLLPSGTREALRWRLDLLPLLRGELRATLSGATDATPAATLAYGHDHFELRGFDLTLPADALVRAAGNTSWVRGVGGNLELHVEHLLWLGNALDARLTAQWLDASVPGPRADIPIDLGEVRVDLDGRGTEITGPVRNRGGDIAIDGELVLAATGATRLDLTLRPRRSEGKQAKLIAAALAMLGRADGEGGYRLSWAGAWR